MTAHYELPIVSFLAVILVLLPLPWHWRARNVATLVLISWLVVINFTRGINAILWMGNVRIRAEWFCDITTKIYIGMGVALPACSFCICRNLEHIASTRVAVTTAADKRRRRTIDLCITIGLPVLVMALHYVVQGHRFDIIEDFGCTPAIYSSIASLIILSAVPLLLSVGSLLLAGLAFRHFVTRRAEFDRHLRDSQSALNTSRYMRLMALALSEMLWGTTLGAYVTFLNVKEMGVRPWISWSDVHYNFSRVAVFPTFLLSKWELDHLFLTWWIPPSTAILFFIFFGLSEEAREGYASSFRWSRRVILRRPAETSRDATYGKGGSLPRFTATRPSKLASISRPDDITLEFPDFKMEPSPVTPTHYDAHKSRPMEPETASALSLTFPGLAADEQTQVPHDEAHPPYRPRSPDDFDVRVSVHHETV